MHLCNKTSNTVWAAMAWVDDDLEELRVWGWWTIEPGSCKTPIGADLDKYVDYYYYAHDNAGNSWTGGTKFCVDNANAFDFNDDQEYKCATDTRRYFKSINTGGSADYTLSLTP